MTTRRDEALERAWKAHSTEQPPPHVDAAILAAAHREVRAKPRAAGDDDIDGVEGQTRHSRAWWTFAAAATIGAIAFGIVELAPPVVDDSTPVVSDVPQAPAAREAAPQPAMRDAPEPPTIEAPQQPAMREAPPRAAMRQAPQVPVTREGPPPEAAPQPAAKPTESAPVARDSERAVPKREAKARNEPGRQDAAGAASTPSAFDSQALAKSEPEQRREAVAQPFPAAPAVVAPPAPSPRARADASTRMPAAGIAASREMTADARVERIRTLHAAGKLDEAIRELQALRRARADADALLPPELREWAASVPREP